MKKILITGAGPHGFIGRNIKEALEERFELFAPSASEVDLLDEKAVETLIRTCKPNYVIHASSTPTNALQDNLKMYFNIARQAGAVEKVIYFGSGAEYDKRFDIRFATEEEIGSSIPVDGYGFAKYIMGQHARLSENIYCLRPFGVFGRYEDWKNKFISNLCCKAVFDLPLTIRRECEFDFLYVQDLIPVVEWMLGGQPKYHDYNVTYGESVKLSALADMVLSASGKHLPITILDRDGENNAYTASNIRLKSECKAFIPTRIHAAVKKLYGYYNSHKELIDYDTLINTR
jgi:GDP-L-fucose synthase